MNNKGYHDRINLWNIDQDYIFLNHGSFGACLKSILHKQSAYQMKLEEEPMKFMTRDLPEYLASSKKILSSFVGANDQNLVFVKNATTGVNTILRSLLFSNGDEIIISNHIYPACRNALNFLAETRGIIIREALIPFPLPDEEAVINQLTAQITPKTRLLLIDHITSPTGLLFPVEKIVNEFNQRKIDVLVDGAHAPGTIPLRLEQMNAAYYTGNCHKWLCSPKGSAFLYVRPDKQSCIHPLTISLTEGKGRSFTDRFYWTGTEDPTPYLCVGDSINEMEKIGIGGWPEITKYNHDLAIKARKMLCEILMIEVPCPENMIANLASVPIPPTTDAAPSGFNHFDSLQDKLFHEFKIELFVTYWPNHPSRLIRISPQIYNTEAQYRYLSEVLQKII